VLASQRLRLLDAMLRQVGERGYDATTVSDVVGRAQVSRNAFYELFADKQDCFLAACDEVGDRSVARVAKLASQPTWIDVLRVGFKDFLTWWDAQPGLMAAYLVDLPTAGRAALEQRDRQIGRFAEILDELAARARREQPELPPMPELATRSLVAGIFDLFGREIRMGRRDRLAELRDPVLALVVRTLADDATAGREIG
jgi:AcrR family transcriptional regulator